MIIIPMMGKSSRFYNAGYRCPKYMLPVGAETVFELSVKTFKSLFCSQHFLFIVRSDDGSKEFVAERVAKMGICDFRIKQLSQDTSGQAETVYSGIVDYQEAEPIIIFNIDTIRYGFDWPTKEAFGDGFLEVFIGEGSGWSFIEAKQGTDEVIRTAEKMRISNLCSNGLYGFSNIKMFRSAYVSDVQINSKTGGEKYIAPLYNFLIKNGKSVKYRLLGNNVVAHCGIPEDYERLVAQHKILS
jgi:dTDP-glucose pyrophosphorylase